VWTEHCAAASLRVLHVMRCMRHASNVIYLACADAVYIYSFSLSLQVVLSASVCTRQGKALVSRQFVEMNRLRVEGLLAAFPKLVNHVAQSNHTYVETDSVRYVYQPLENQMYLLLITTKASNIVEDLGTLRLLAKVVPDVAGGLHEGAINDHAFDLIFAFDEVLTTGGYKEEVTLSTIRTNLLMDSHEEKIHMALKQSKEEQARAEMQRQAKTIKERQMAQLRQNMMQGGITSAMEGFGGGGNPGGTGGFMAGFDSSNAYQQQQGNKGQFNYGAPVPAVPEPPKVLAKGGMKLGGIGTKKDSLMAAMAAEDNLMPLAPSGAGKGGFDLNTAPVKPVVTPSTPVSLILEEKITVQMNREGAVDSCELKGTLTFTANTDAGVMAQVLVNKAGLPKNFNFATHPKVDKKDYETKGMLALKGGKGFPVQRPVGILRWSYTGVDAAPITINCWPEDEGTGRINVNVELELTRPDLTLYDVNILLPLGTTDPPSVESMDGQYQHDARAGMLCWHFDQLDSSNSSGSLEFSISGRNTEVFYPIQVGFRSETLLCPIQVVSVTQMQSGGPVPHQMSKSLAPDNYTCV
jgi:coatomer subunit delta